MQGLTKTLTLIWAIFFTVSGLGLFITPRLKEKLKSILDNPKRRYLIFYSTASAGLIQVFFYNNWESHQSILISIIGWLAFLKGVLLLLSPDFMNLSKSILKSQFLFIFGIFSLALGIYLFTTII